MSITRDVDRFLHEKREKRRLKRLQEKQGARVHDQGLIGTSSGLTAFRGHIPSARAKGKTRDIEIVIPSRFSIIDTPEEALQVLYNLVLENDRYRRIKKIFFNHADLSDYDLAAEQLLDHLAAEIGRERMRQKPRLNHAGTFPSDARASRFIRGIGIIRTLGMEDQYLSHSEKEALEIFDKMDNNALRTIRKASEKTPRDSAVQGFTDHVDNCLGRYGHQLTREGRQGLGLVVGEVIDNAIQHSKGDGWIIAGYLDTEDPNNICEIAVINFGISIADTLKALPSEHFTSQLVRPYVMAHTRAGLFGRKWTEEDLLTLVALQENISSKNDSPDDTRGSGTVDLIEFFQLIYEECGSRCAVKPRMAILSGRTHIVFDGKYRLTPDSKGRPVIAFNKENRLDLEPDRSYFTRMKKYPFPGTAVCVRFPLQKHQYEKAEDFE